MTEFVSQASLAFAAGLLSVFSPCVMPLMPAYLSLISGISVEEMQRGVSDAALRWRVMQACLGFVAGFSTVFVLMGVGAVAIGHTVRTWRSIPPVLPCPFSRLAGVSSTSSGRSRGSSCTSGSWSSEPEPC
jgi:cytochrome c biogenesis protein CcdA